MKKIKLLGLAGLLLACPLHADEFFHEKYGTPLFITGNETHLFLGYDTDGDLQEDMRLIYQFVGVLETKQGYYELERILSDKNRDGKFTPDELIWQRTRAPQKPLIQLS